MEYKEGKDSLRHEPPHHLSFQSFTIPPLPTLNEVLLLVLSQTLLMAFHNPTPKPLLLSLKHPPPSSPQYFPTITCLHRDPFSEPNLQFYLPSNALLWIERCLIPSPPFHFSLQVIAHLTKCCFFPNNPHAPQ